MTNKKITVDIEKGFESYFKLGSLYALLLFQLFPLIVWVKVSIITPDRCSCFCCLSRLRSWGPDTRRLFNKKDRSGGQCNGPSMNAFFAIVPTNLRKVL